MTELDRNKKLAISGEVNYKIRNSIAMPVTVMIYEISGVGVKFVTSETLEPETLLEMELRVTETSDPISAIGKVVDQKIGQSKFLLNTEVEFTEIDAKYESRLLHFINNFADDIKVKRTMPRCSMMTNVYYSHLSDAANQGTCISADICMIGMKLYISEDMPVGTKIRLTFTMPDKYAPPVAVIGEVVWKKKEPQKMIGLKFVGFEEYAEERIYNYIKRTLEKF